MKHDTRYAERAFYRVLVKAPIETVWSELIKTSSPRPFFWNSSWDAQAMARGNAYRVVPSDGAVHTEIDERRQLAARTQ